jgi:hypothetical protein
MSKKLEIKNERTIEYLEDILNGTWLIHNPTKLEVPGIGKIIATSRLQYDCENDEIFPYFAFKQNGTKGEIMKQKGHYYKTIEQEAQN